MCACASEHLVNVVVNPFTYFFLSQGSFSGFLASVGSENPTQALNSDLRD